MVTQALRDPILIPLECNDIQSLLLSGHARLEAARFYLIRFGPRGQAAKWLGRVPIAYGRRDSREAPAVQAAFTYHGLAHLGLDEETLARFSRPFVDGMVPRDWANGGDHRCRALGDIGENEPGRWTWGNEAEPWHGILMLYAQTEAIEEHERDHERELSEAQIQFVKLPASRVLRDERMLFREHFGFVEGIGNPILEGLEGEGLPPPAYNLLAPGEIVLGYPGQDKRLPPSPRLASGVPGGGALPGGDLGRNGSYMVVRQLEQHVGRFWRFMMQQAENKALAIYLAAKMVGRWPNGAPMTKWLQQPTRPPNQLDDDFLYEADPDGERCPVGAHIRRANPRDLPFQQEASSALQNTRRRRILRRGRTYGEPVGPIGRTEDLIDQAIKLSDEEDIDRGLLFVAFNVDVERQYEFVQQTWLLSRKFAGLPNDPDPLLSNPGHPRGLGPGEFTFLHAGRNVRIPTLELFVHVKGGAYFFLPGRRALKYFAGVAATLAARDKALDRALAIA